MSFFTHHFFRIAKSGLFFLLMGLSFVAEGQFYIYNGSVESGFVMGADSHFGDRDWLETIGKAVKMSYPGKQGWGAVFITVGQPYPDSQKERRRTKDMSGFTMLSIDLKGEIGGEKVWIGMKDKNDLNNGAETKRPITVSSDWRTYNIILADFKTADLKSIHVPIEIIFGQEKCTVYFRNICFY